MGLKKYILALPLLWAACSVTQPNAFIDNLYSLSLKVPGASTYSIAVSQFSNSFTIKTFEADGTTVDTDETFTVLRSWSSTKALARRKGNTPPESDKYVALRIEGGALYISAFFPSEGEVTEATPTDTPYLEKR